MMYSWLHKYTTVLVKGRCTLKPVLDESLPIYQQIADMIMDDIIDGQLKEDEKIPSENEIAQFFSINRATIRKGLQVLLDMDLLYKKRGIGMFVKKGARAKLIRERQKNYTVEKVQKTKYFCNISDFQKVLGFREIYLMVF